MKRVYQKKEYVDYVLRLRWTHVNAVRKNEAVTASCVHLKTIVCYGYAALC